jgi:hypothetical protein
MGEHRVAPRHRILKAGTIEFGGGAIDCTIRNMSNTGAALDVASPVGILVQFTLVLPADGSHVPCHVVWRKETRNRRDVRLGRVSWWPLALNQNHLFEVG